MSRPQNHETFSPSPRRRAILLVARAAEATSTEADSATTEIEQLVRGLDISVIATRPLPKTKGASANYLGAGGLKDLALLTGGQGEVRRGPQRMPNPSDSDDDHADEMDRAAGEADEHDEVDGDIVSETASEGAEPIADLFIVDDELTPSQERNLERALEVEVWDRPKVILEIFAQRARTREARLGVELAQLRHELPRIRDDSSLGDQEGGGGRAARGHSNVELAKQRTRSRIQALEKELLTVRAVAQTQRARRRENLRVALVGYTNAGKSSLMRALCGSEVFVQDQLFATLGTTTRKLSPASSPTILVTDTVGFIRRLPHALVASFRSTLDEVNETSLLLYVVDASDPGFRQQLQVTLELIAEVGAADIPHQLVLNKTDRLGDADRAALEAEFPDALFVSAHARRDVQRVREAIIEFFDAKMITEEVELSYAQSGALHELREQFRILSQDFAETQRLSVRGLPEAVAQLKRRLTQ